MSWNEWLFDPLRFDYELRQASCTRDGCFRVGLERVPIDDPEFIVAIGCPECGLLCYSVEFPSVPIPERERPHAYIAGSESEPWLADTVHGRLNPYFEVYRQVKLKHRSTQTTHRIDLVAVPREPLNETFPYRALGIEVKNREARVQGFRQSLAYRQCRFNDTNQLVALRAEDIDCVALYQGRKMGGRRFTGDDGGETVRVVGGFNVGELVHDAWHGTALLVSGSRIWSSRAGVPPYQRTAPRKRRIANSKKRQ